MMDIHLPTDFEWKVWYGWYGELSYNGATLSMETTQAVSIERVAPL